MIYTLLTLGEPYISPLQILRAIGFQTRAADEVVTFSLGKEVVFREFFLGVNARGPISCCSRSGTRSFEGAFLCKGGVLSSCIFPQTRFNSKD
jgi:hypothetical protein